MKATLAVMIALGMLAACKGQPSELPPIYYFDHMFQQQKYKAESANSFFADGRSMRPQVDGTVPDNPRELDDAFMTGKVDGEFLTRIPVPVDAKLVARGQDRFQIYCTPCHDRTGGGQGLVVQIGKYPPPIVLTESNARGLADGEIFSIMSNGQRNMPGYYAQIPAADRWAIVSWVRVLQRSQNATSKDIPAGVTPDPEGSP